MKYLKKISLVVVLLVISYSSLAQNTHNFTQFYFNPALLNPSFTGSDGRLAMYASFKKQWVGIDGAPTIGNFSLQTALPKRVNVGFNASNDKNGLISTSGVLFTGGYTLPLTPTNYLRFGLSIGAAWNKVDLNALKFGTAGDPVQANLMASNFQIMGNAGVSFHTPTFHAGLSIPNILDPAYLSSESFSVSKVNPFGAIIAHASNRFYFAKNKNIFEPYLIYRYNQNSPSQLEVAAIVHLQNLIWFGGSYKQDYGISALTGFKLKGQTAVGYSYSLKNTGANQLSAPSHEIHLGILFGPKVKKVSTYSFVDTEKEKTHRKTPAQIAAEKKKHEADLVKQKEAEKKKEETLAQQKKKEQDALAQKKKDEEAQKLAKAEEKKKVTEPKKEEVIVAKAATVTQETKKPDSTATQKLHNGGPRLRSSLDIPGETEPDSVHLAEQNHIRRLGDHSQDPTEQHNEPPHPNAERHEFVKRGNHVDEMEIGDYIVAGVFRSKENAKHFSDGLVSLGFSITDFGYLTEKNLWYVYLGETEDLEMAKTERDKYRKMKMFKDCWLLTVHH